MTDLLRRFESRDRTTEILTLTLALYAVVMQFN